MFCLIICRHSRGIASTMLIKLKYSIGDRFAFNTLTPFRKNPASEKRSTIVMIPLEKKAFFKYQALFNSNIFIIQKKPAGQHPRTMTRQFKGKPNRKQMSEQKANERGIHTYNLENRPSFPC